MLLLTASMFVLLGGHSFAQSGDYIVSGYESWAAGEYHLNSLTVLPGAALKGGGGFVIYATTVTVETGGSISVDGEGYAGAPD